MLPSESSDSVTSITLVGSDVGSNEHLGWVFKQHDSHALIFLKVAADEGSQSTGKENLKSLQGEDSEMPVKANVALLLQGNEESGRLAKRDAAVGGTKLPCTHISYCSSLV